MRLSLLVRNLVPALLLVLLLFLVVLIYLPGLKGGFLFDDYPNLQELGTYGGVVNLETFNNFVFHGISSPLGRPLSLATFLLDDNTWPSKAIWFKETNLKIHLLTGLLLCWASLNLMRVFGRSENEAVWIALLSGAIWLLHPYMLSTTLYVVQRMAQLAALFVFGGLAAYLHGRLLLMRGEVLHGYIWMSVSIVIATPLALLSKENGVLLPMLIGVIELCLPQTVCRLWIWWRVVFLWLPSLAILYKLGKEINFSPDAWPNRPFTQSERLLTEPRILWEYLYQLYVPKIEGRGLFQDGYAFSRGLLSPISTIISIIGLFACTIAAIIFRHRYSLLCLGFLFYIVAHLLESSVIGLELYFEHRNYMSAAFLFLPLAAGIVDLHKKSALWISVFGCILLLTMLSFLTWQRAKLWSNTTDLERYWASSTPESPRAQNKLGALMLEAGNVDQSIQHMENAVKLFPQSSLLTTNLLLIRVYAERVDESDFIAAADRFRSQPFDAQAVMGMRNLVDACIAHPNQKQYLSYMLTFIEQAKGNPLYARFHLFNKLVPYLKARLYLTMGNYDLAYQEFSNAIPMYNDTDSALSMVAEMGNADRPVEALLLFKQAELVFVHQPDSDLKRSRELYNVEFARMRKILDENLNAIGIGKVEETDGSQQRDK